MNAKTTSGGTPLMLASNAGNIEMVQMLLDAGADIKAKDREGRTAISVASARGHENIVSLISARMVGQ
jgi:ankyrin repeat protein